MTTGSIRAGLDYAEGGLFADLVDSDSTREIVPADELLHPPTSDRSWTETVWFATIIPEHHMVCWLYMLFRRNIGTVDAGLWIFDDTTFVPWEMPYARFRWNLPLPSSELTDAWIGDNIHYQVLDPFRHHRITYQDGALVNMDLSFRAHLPARPVGLKDDTGHIDQAVWTTGTIEVDGRRIEVDGPTMRDRSWGPRPDTVGRKAHYSFGISKATMFQALVVYDPDGTTQTVRSGSLHRDGQWAPLRNVTRRVLSRRDGPPLRIAMTLEDELGRTAELIGTTVTSGALQPHSSIFSWISMVRWVLDGETIWGEDDEAWTPEVLASARRRRPQGDPFDNADGLLPSLR